jgi:tRNA(Arg) A34 adenosine deaminase TadA
MIQRELRISLPKWVETELPDLDTPVLEIEDRMRLVTGLAGKNIEHGGGPFAAAVFDDQKKLISIGLNRVIQSNCSSAHAEVMAISLAQQAIGHYALPHSYELVVSAEPCAMCAGAIPWSGIGHLVTAATDQDIRAIGFDEGSKPSDWKTPLLKRGISVTSEVLRAEAVAILERYRQQGGEIYNGSQEQG